ncbi:MAG: glucose-6-phosphate isomerase family protein [Acidobacteriota bacterium]|nr:glucose-6-phosphate isomerase family protein [Acidobacteriota bacterium]
MGSISNRSFGIDVTSTFDPLGFVYGPESFGPEPELRTLDAIRSSLLDPTSTGPEVVYAIAMDVGNNRDRQAIVSRNLLFGVVTYARGRVGREPVRSQGHVHTPSPSCGSSTCEVYEIWSGRACIYMQETAEDDPGRCFAVFAGPGEVVVVPPTWAHAAINADVSRNLTFGAWCVRDYGFDYEGVRGHGGMAWFPICEDDGSIGFVRNPRYHPSTLVQKTPEDYEKLGIERDVPIYRQFEQDPDRFLFVSNPRMAEAAWQRFTP